MRNSLTKNTFLTKEEVRSQIAQAVNAFLIKLHKKQKPFLLLLSGGSALEVLRSISDEHFSPRATIAVLDERYSTNPANNNMAQLQQTEFYSQVIKKGCHVINTTVAKQETMNNLANRFEHKLLTWKQDNPKGEIIAIVGIGPDGHTSGMMPFPEDARLFMKLFEDPKKIVVAYDAQGKNPHRYRVTTTNIFLRNFIDYAFIYAVGENKKNALRKVFSEDGDLSTTPARIIREMKHVDLFTDVAL